jgi:Cobyric acid synthase
MKIVFLGTSSGAGKTVMTAMFCRYLRKKGISVAPFKASNLSLNSFATKDGKEIGMGQAFQALASEIDATAEMNPILLKPSGNGIQTVINGTVSKRSKSEIGTEELLKEVLNAYDSLSGKYDAIVSEGSGSPAELNLTERDIANIRFPKERSVPSVLVGDIDRGGVFAGIYGTWLLLDDVSKELMKGFIINRFRGDDSILKAGTDRIEELTGMKFLGTMPLADLKFPDEDSLSVSSGKLSGSNVREAYLRNLDELTEIAEKHLDMDMLMYIAKGN